MLTLRLPLSLIFSCLLSLVSLPVLSSAQPTEVPSPNVILIIADDMGPGDLACMGNPLLQTPALDRLHAESTRLTQFVVSPLCAPSRASLMTGLYNYRVGVWDTWLGRADMNTGIKTLGDYFQEAGYRTGYFGKWHLGRNAPMRPQDRGFERSVLWADGTRFDAHMEVDGQRVATEGFFDDVFFDEALNFLNAVRREPFFAVISSYMPHDHAGIGLQVAEHWVAPYRDVPDLAPGDAEVYGMMANLDANVDRVLNWLDENGLTDRTIVIFLSDNGPVRQTEDLKSRPEQLAIEKHQMGARFNRGLRAGKTTVYEGGILVPFFIRWPGTFPAGRDLNRLSAHIDLLPTLAEVCGLELEATPELDGESLLPSILTSGQSGQQGKPPDAVPHAVIIQQDRSATPRKWENMTVRSERWKLVGDNELYDLHEDPGETKNVFSLYPERAQQLAGLYEQWWNGVTAGANFRAGRTNLGSDSQAEVLFNVYHRPPNGWPVKLLRSGSYRITVEGIQQDMLQGPSQLHVSLPGQTARKAIPAETDTVQFDLNDLQTAEGQFDLWIEPAVEERRMYYGNPDPGWRSVRIEFTGQSTSHGDS